MRDRADYAGRPDGLAPCPGWDRRGPDAELSQRLSRACTSRDELAAALLDGPPHGALLLWEELDVEKVLARLGARDVGGQQALERRGGRRGRSAEPLWA